MNHTLKLTLQRVEGAVIRTLGLIERRGFAVTAINTASDESSPHLELTLQISSPERSAETLARHVEKLFDVRHVDLVAAGTPAVRMKESVAC
jgi:acetolactate synthase regulatory subunit